MQNSPESPQNRLPQDEYELANAERDMPANDVLMREKIIGMSNQSMRKSYYPALRQRIEQLERYRQLLDKAGEAVCLLRFPGLEFEDINLTATTVFNTERSILLDSTLLMHVNSEAAEELSNWTATCFDSGKLHTTIRFLSTDIHENANWHEANLSAINFKQQKYVVALIKNITEEYKLDEETSRNSALLRAMFDNSFQFIGLLDTQGHLLAANQTALNLIGSEGKDFIGRFFWDTPWWNHSEKIRQQLISAFKDCLNGEFIRYETVNFCSDGKAIDIDFSLKPVFNKDKQVIMVIPEGRDISEKKRLENILQHTQKIESIGQLAGGIAHDFNNMLGGIMGAAEILQLKYSEIPEAQNLVKMILNTAGKASFLTSRLLAFSRKDNPSTQITGINEIIRESAALLERSIDKNIGLLLQLKAANDVISGDPVQLQSAIINLGINARDSMPKGGSITISTDNVIIDKEFCKNSMLVVKPGEYIRMSVRDRGTGIAEKDIERIFEPFFTTKPSGKGTGLGLAAVYNTAKEHNGTITIISCPGSGTTFAIYLPVASTDTQAHAARTETQELQAANKQHKCALVIDDEDIIRTTTRYMLESIGFSVLTAGNGKEGLTIYRSSFERTDLIILDIVMPQMGGKEAFAEIRRINPNAKIIFTSGFTRQTSTESLPQDDKALFIQKPFKMQQLKACIADLSV